MKKILSVILAFCMVVFVPLSVYPASKSETAVCLNAENAFSGDKAHAEQLRSRLDSAGYYALNNDLPTSAYGYNAHLSNSVVLFSSSHGTLQGGKLVLSNSASYSADNVPSSLNKTEFVFLSACYSMKTNAVSGNLGNALISAGVSAVVGYKDTVKVDASRYFEEQFFMEALSNGASVATAFGIAKGRVAAKYGNANAVFTSSELKGNGSLHIN